MPNFLEGKPGKESTNITSEFVDFGRATFHSAIENPVNGVVQLLNHVSGAKLPEMKLVGAPEQRSIGSVAGNIVGGALDFYLLSKVGGKALGSIGGPGLGGTMLRSAAIGGVFEGVLQPSVSSSQNFYADRFTSALVGAGTFAAMAAGGAALNKTGLYAVPEARSLIGSVTYGGFSGALGGVAHAEANAVFKQGKPLPSVQDLLSDGVSYGAFGAAFGAMGYGYNRLTTQTQFVQSDKGSIEVRKDADGNPVSFKAKVPSIRDPEILQIRWNSQKMTDGSWAISSSKAYDAKTGEYYGRAEVPLINDVISAADGSIKVVANQTSIRTFAPGGKYERYSPTDKGYRTGDPQVAVDQGAGYRSVVDGNGERTYNPQGRPIRLATADRTNQSVANVQYDESGKINVVTVTDSDLNSSYLKRTGSDTWDAVINRRKYSWNGDVNVQQSVDGKSAESISFVPKTGAPITFNPAEKPPALSVLLSSTGKFQEIASGYGFARSDANGNIFVNQSPFELPSVNGKPISAETQIHPGDQVNVRVDVGDRFPEFETRLLKLGTTSDGTATLNNQALSPNSALDFEALTAKQKVGH